MNNPYAVNKQINNTQSEQTIWLSLLWCIKWLPTSPLLTTALTFLQARFSGWSALLSFNMKCFVLSSLLSLSLAAPAPKAAADAAAAPFSPHLVPHAAPYAAVPVQQLQWPGVAAPGLDTTCFGCRSHVLVPVGRGRRSADAEAVAEAVAEASPDADAYHTALNGYAHNLGSGHSFAAISTGPALPYVPAVPAYPAVYGYPHPYLG